jgi:hypothetical protein
MMFFCSLMALIVSVLMLCLLFDDLARRKAKPTPNDYVMDGFMLIGFISAVVVSFHSLMATFH